MKKDYRDYPKLYALAKSYVKNKEGLNELKEGYLDGSFIFSETKENFWYEVANHDFSNVPYHLLSLNPFSLIFR